MYKVYLDDVMIHHQNDNDLRLNTAKVEQELNKAGSFVYSMNQNHSCYGAEKKLKSLVTVYSDDTLMFRGRVLDIDVGFYGDRTVTCEGELSFLIDSIQRPYEFSGSPATLFIDLLTSHNSEVEDAKKFLPGRMTVVDANDYIARSDSTYLNTRDSLDKKLVEPLGGYLIPRHENDGVYLDYLADLTDYNSQEVTFGENLLDLSKFISGTDIVTAVIPIGAEDEETGEKLSIADVNSGVDYVYDQEAVDEYGWIFQTVEFDDVTLASNLLTKAYEVLEEVKSSLPAIELTAVDLNAIDCDIASFEVGKLTKVTSKIHDLSEEYLTWKRSINLLNPADSKLYLGGEQEGLTSTTSSISKDITSIQEVVDTENGVLMAEKVQGVINLANTSLKAQLNEASTQDIVAMLFENVDPNSATYGAMAIGTQGIQISKQRNETDTGWAWGTAIDFQSIQAEMIIAGILSDKLGLNYWDLDKGILKTKNMVAEDIDVTSGSIRVASDLHVGNNIYMNQEDTGVKYLYMSEDSYLRSWNSSGWRQAVLWAPWVVLRNDLSNIDIDPNGAISIYADGTLTSNKAITVASDERLKENISDTDTSWIYELLVKEYTYIADKCKRKQIGVIAQHIIGTDAEKYLVDTVKPAGGTDEDVRYSVDYQSIAMACVRELQKLRARVDILEGSAENE